MRQAGNVILWDVLALLMATVILLLVFLALKWWQEERQFRRRVLAELAALREATGAKAPPAGGLRV